MPEIDIEALDGDELKRIMRKRRELEALDTSRMSKAEKAELRRIINKLARMENAEQCSLACVRKWGRDVRPVDAP